jgi:hypothetical protein
VAELSGDEILGAEREVVERGRGAEHHGKCVVHGAVATHHDDSVEGAGRGGELCIGVGRVDVDVLGDDALRAERGIKRSSDRGGAPFSSVGIQKKGGSHEGERKALGNRHWALGMRNASGADGPGGGFRS